MSPVERTVYQKVMKDIEQGFEDEFKKRTAKKKMTESKMSA